jgi:flagellar biogenesis protein FliO
VKPSAWLVAACVTLAAASVVAAPAAPAPSPAWLRPDKPLAKRPLEMQHGPSPLRIGAMLLLVAGLGGVAFYARRKRQGAVAAEPKTALRVLGTTRVGPKATAVVVEVAGKRLLLGVTEQAVSTLAWLDDEANAALDDGREASGVTERAVGAQPLDDVATAGPSGFLRLLRNAVGTGTAQKATPASPPRAAADEIAGTLRDEVRLSFREQEDPVAFEGQVMGLARRRKETP